MEIWDLYNENREIIGEHISDEKLPDNAFHLVVHVWIKNEDGKYLISQRNFTRPTNPLMWECVGGSILKSENSLQGAKREVMEEVGVNLSNIEGKLVFSKIRKIESGEIFNDILDVWLFKYNGKIPLEEATTDEVLQSKWLYVQEIRDLYESGRLVPSLYYFFDKVANI